MININWAVYSHRTRSSFLGVLEGWQSWVSRLSISTLSLHKICIPILRWFLLRTSKLTQWNHTACTSLALILNTALLTSIQVILRFSFCSWSLTGCFHFGFGTKCNSHSPSCIYALILLWGVSTLEREVWAEGLCIFNFTK